MGKRYLHFKDLFEVRCKKCGSINVDLEPDVCEECGIIIDAECNDCKSKFNYHDFIQVEGE